MKIRRFAGFPAGGCFGRGWEGFVEDKKSPAKGAHNCKWAEPTLFERAPRWLEAEAKPWTCHRDAAAKSLETTEVCEDCPRWELRDESGQITPKV
jgi:hypothetical protein